MPWSSKLSCTPSRRSLRRFVDAVVALVAVLHVYVLLHRGHVCACVCVCVCVFVLFEQVRDVRATAPKAAVEKVRAANRQRRDEVLDESAAHANKIALERAEEQARKDDLIRQIRALEKVPKPKVRAAKKRSSQCVA